MGDKTRIEWADATWNPLRAMRKDGTGKIGWHCEQISPACDHCYAARQNLTGWAGGTKLEYAKASRSLVRSYLDAKTLEQPLRWKRPRRIFVCSMTDIFGAWVLEEQIDTIFAMMYECQWHTFMVLTKRARRMAAYFADPRRLQRIATCVYRRLAERSPEKAAIVTPRDVLDDLRLSWPLPQIELGVTAENQACAVRRVPNLLECPAAVRFVSAEPLLGPLDVSPWLSGVDGVIVGGESGTNARPMHPKWARDLRDQCAAGTAFFFKQWGEWLPVYDREAEDPDWQRCGVIKRQTPRGAWLNLAGGSGFHGDQVVRVDRVGKKAAGRLLDGVLHDELPARPAGVA